MLRKGGEKLTRWMKIRLNSVRPVRGSSDLVQKREGEEGEKKMFDRFVFEILRSMCVNGSMVQKRHLRDTKLGVTRILEIDKTTYSVTYLSRSLVGRNNQRHKQYSPGDQISQWNDKVSCLSFCECRFCSVLVFHSVLQACVLLCFYICLFH